MKGTAPYQDLATMLPILKEQKEYKCLTAVDWLSKLCFLH